MENSPYIATSSWTNHFLIAHAAGSVDHQSFTNSREAFEQNYNQGYRVFEVDLQLTTDGYLLSRHDWGNYLYDRFKQVIPREQMDRPAPLELVLSLPIYGRYHAMSFEQIAELLQNYPDIWVVTDTKGTSEHEVRQQFEAMLRAAAGKEGVLDRVVPQLYSRDMLRWVESVHSFPSYIYTLYQSQDTDQQVLDFVRAEPKIDAIAIVQDRAMKSASLIARLESLRVPVYAHTVNDPTAIRDLAAIGVDGVYSDSMTYERLEQSRIRLPKRNS
ncbi:phosphatidylinositol-specific phospholipase C/glycerophosphodiester phosphodiesterase family protein [Paenibacillus albicereus]|uniref:phosphatidylinositol-specific phospholipase C/glycerophosphodiester phosphodiesterase family protein n=1 Tax=Paenibacillus albicereus TaxID=2726185 RepID=UPI002E2C54B6|nr:phosphatidylinositol-specific phospholipase C/glycerophosphodiester phosphodiesterase family protein [Paenibacillus albicereus]